MADREKEIDLAAILNEKDLGSKINMLAVIADHNRLTLIGHTAALVKLEIECQRGYNRREKAINWGSAIGAILAAILASIGISK